MDRRQFLRASAVATGILAGCGRPLGDTDGEPATTRRVTGLDSPVEFADGAGTPIDPYQVETLEQLQAVAGEPTAHYRLVADVDASPTASWNDGAGFVPIGEFVPESDREEGVTYAFTGSFDGGGHAITGLTIDRPEEARGGTGLFGVARDAWIEGVELADATVTGTTTGGLVGDLRGGTIRQVAVTGEIAGGDRVAGVAGASHGTVVDASAAGTVTGGRRVGGLIGEDGPGSVRNAHATATVSGDEFVGGLVGHGGTRIQDASASGDVDGNRSVGGLVGRSTARIERCETSGAVESEGAAGGVVGEQCCESIRDVCSRGDLRGDPVGGLVGVLHDGSLARAYATGRQRGDGGAFVGIHEEGKIEDCYGGAPAEELDRLRERGHDVSDLQSFADLRGESATAALPAFDFESTWRTTATFPAPRDPGALAVTSLEPDRASVASGSDLAVSATVENTGERPADESVSLRVGGVVVAAQTVAASPGESVTVDLSGAPPEGGVVGDVSPDGAPTGRFEPGEYVFGAYTETDAVAGSLTVEDGG